ncbi:uncharacterized protein LOC144451308 [Glandiceps talaboti]
MAEQNITGDCAMSSNIEMGDETTVPTDTTIVTSETDGKSMFRLREALDKTVVKCMEKTSRYSLYAHTYKFAHRNNPKLLKSTIRQLNENLEASVKTEFEVMMKEENIVSLCNRLDKAVDETPVPEEAKPAWRPSGSPEKDLHAHIMLTKLKEKENLQKELEELEKSSLKIQEVFNARKTYLLESQKKVKDRVKHFTENSGDGGSCDGSDINDGDGGSDSSSGVSCDGSDIGDGGSDGSDIGDGGSDGSDIGDGGSDGSDIGDGGSGSDGDEWDDDNVNNSIPFNLVTTILLVILIKIVFLLRVA